MEDINLLPEKEDSFNWVALIIGLVVLLTSYVLVFIAGRYVELSSRTF